MRIGIITFHFAYNYGAVLQAWALQNYLQNKGHIVEIIDYRPKYHTERYGVVRSLKVAASNTYKKYGFNIYRIIRAIIGTFIENIVLYRERKKKKCYFESFISNHLNLSTSLYTNIDLCNTFSKYEILIAGSDQIWNKNLTNNAFDMAYFLPFGNNMVRRIIYGVSIGETKVLECINYIKRNKFNIDFYSCREYNDSIEFSKLLEKHCFCVCDPTLLLRSLDYKKIEVGINEQNYYLVYILKENTILNDYIKKLIRSGKKIVNISPIKIVVDGLISKYPVTPSEFISYIKNADFIITNSFHGTVFSLIYNKQFICGLHGNRNNRIVGLLEQLNLSNRIVTSENDIHMASKNIIQYDIVSVELNKISNTGISFLYNAINEI